MRNVPAQAPKARREARPAAPSAGSPGGTVIPVERTEAEPASRGASRPIPAPPVWGGMASAPPPTRDFRGPFGFLMVLGAVALTAIGLFLYAGWLDRDPGVDELSVEGQTRSAAGGGRPADAPASLWINGAPYGAVVRIDADSVGTLPLTVDELLAGDYLVTVEAGGVTRDTLLSVAPGARAAVFLQLDTGGDLAQGSVELVDEPPAEEAAPAPREAAAPEPRATAPTTGLLRVTSRPAGATIRLDGTVVGTTPLALPEVQAGAHTVTASLAGHQDRDLRVEMSAGGDQTVRFALDAQAAPATLEVLARPWGSIYIDGELSKRNTDVVFRAQLPAGRHEIRVVHPTFGSRSRTVTLESGQSLLEVFDLTAGVDG